MQTHLTAGARKTEKKRRTKNSRRPGVKISYDGLKPGEEGPKKKNKRKSERGPHFFF